MYHDTDHIALATEAIAHEGSDAYLDADPHILAVFLTEHPDLWTPPTADSAWSTHAGFGTEFAAWVKQLATLNQPTTGEANR